MMASSRVLASRLASQMAATTSQVVRPAIRVQLLNGSKRTMTGASQPLQTLKRQQTSSVINATTRQAFAVQGKRAYSSEMAQAMVEVSRNLGMGVSVVGLAGPGVGIGLVFAALMNATARNPALRDRFFTNAILGFAFVEAIGLFDLMVAFMIKYL